MENTFDFQAARAYAYKYGAIVGLCWIISFLSFVNGLSTPFLADIGLVLGIASVFVAGNIIRFYHNARQELTFRRAWQMALTLFLCAAVLTAAAQYVYFQYMDHGTMAQAYEQILTAPEYQAHVQQILPQQGSKDMIQEMIDLLYTITPIQMTIQLFIYNLFLGLLLSLPTALLGKRKKIIRKE